ncbi:hypothetical protein [Flavobacterium collinsii]|nr:hypothetical protein [Flavobacterium collinsii]
MKIIKFYNKIESKMREKMIFKKKSDEDTFKTSFMIFTIVMLFLLSFSFFENEFQKSEGIYRLLALGIVIAAAIVAILYFRLLINETDRKNNNIGININEDLNNERTNEFGDKVNNVDIQNDNIRNNEKYFFDTNIENSSSKNIFSNEIITILSKIINENRMPDESGRSVFGISSFQKTKSKTQLAILLNLVKEDLFKDEYAGIGDKKFIDAFFDKIEAEPITHQYFGQIKNDIIIFKRKKFESINEDSDYYNLYEKFKDILIANNN